MFKKLVAFLCMVLICNPIICKANERDNDFDSKVYANSRNTSLYIAEENENGLLIGMNVDGRDSSELTYSWRIILNDYDIDIEDCSIQSNEWLIWQPQKYGEYTIMCYAWENDSIEMYMTSIEYSYHPIIKGICQMPYSGEGGGYLIGIESYDNPNNSYKYEMLILDCTLLAENKDAWTYSTGKCKSNTNCLWTVWQPEYGYYWTLFRIFDENNKMIDEICYGFSTANPIGEPDLPDIGISDL